MRNLLSLLALAALPLAGCASAGPGAPAPASASSVEYVGHRGASADAPENTLASFNLAWERGAKAIELDVHLTSDGALIVSHDANTKRVTGVDHVIAQSTLAELRTLDAGRWKGEKWRGERLPTLAEALATVPADGKCYIEIKIGAEAVPAVAAAIRESGKRPDQIVIISFQLDAVEAAKRALPAIPAYYLASFKRDPASGAWTPSINSLIHTAKEAGLDGLDLSYSGPLTTESVRKIHDAGLGLYVWTVDDPAVARGLIEMGVDGITSNRPVALKREVESPSTFTNPIISSQAAPDPWVIRHGDRYYFTATLDPEEGLWVWSSPTLTGLDRGRKVKVWNAPASGPMSAQIWAPELHFLNGRWYLYFTASDGMDRHHHHYVLAALTDDPQGPYAEPVPVDPSYTGYGIDGSVLRMPDGRLYFMYADDGIMIAPMSGPTRLAGPRVRIATGTRDWEHGWRQQNREWVKDSGYWLEAPEALIHEGRVFIVYSAGHSATPHYYVGLLTLTGSDPLDPAAWTKAPDPLFAPYEGPDGKVFTPGHNSFTRSPDGREDWLVYHAKDLPTGGFAMRTTRIQPFTWKADGTPDFGHPIPAGVPIRKPSGE